VGDLDDAGQLRGEVFHRGAPPLFLVQGHSPVSALFPGGPTFGYMRWGGPRPRRDESIIWLCNKDNPPQADSEGFDIVGATH
jgi:hypothetical protein